MTLERWSDGDAYEAFVGHLSRAVAPIFVEWLGVDRGGRWVDVGSGTGALSATILQGADPVSIVAVDPSPDFVAAAQATIADPRVRFEIGSADALPIADATADAVVAGLVLNFVPDVPAALAEMRRVAVPGATVAAYVWDYAEGMGPIRRFFDAARLVDAGAEAADEGRRFAICRPGPLGDAFRAAGLERVQVRTIDVPAVYRSFEAYWTPFLSGVGAAPRYLAALPPATQVAIREQLRSTLRPEADGSIHLAARAWAARGRV
ncbi:MAG TPA: methyltransferase domain-containing protein [Candidatus Limnocylindrales bacterium]|jgi:SAM-dependent methyltransferase